MAIISPFKAVRPTRDKVGLFATRTYLSYSKKGLNEKLLNNPFTFLQIINPNFNQKKTLKGNQKFELIKKKYKSFLDQEIIKKDKVKAFYIYYLNHEGHEYKGIIASASTKEYEKGIIKKKGKKITIDRSAYNSTQPNDTLKNICTLLSVFSQILKEEKVIKNEMSSNEINNLIKHNFSFCWYQFYKFLFPYCLRWKNYFGDMEIFTILATIILNNNSKIGRQLKGVDSYLDKWRDKIINKKIKGINAMSISEITGIPRPTVVRKIKKLIKNKFISLDKNKLINFDVSKQNFKDMSIIQDENLKSINVFIKRTYNQINLN